MDDFQHRLLVALERLAGREGDGRPLLGDRLEGLGMELAHVSGRLDAVTEVLQEIRDQLAGLREDMPGGGGGGHP